MLCLKVQHLTAELSTSVHIGVGRGGRRGRAWPTLGFHTWYR